MRFNFLLSMWIMAIAAVTQHWPNLNLLALSTAVLMLCLYVYQKIFKRVFRQPLQHILFTTGAAIIILAVGQHHVKNSMQQRLAFVQHDVRELNAIVYVNKMAEQNRNGLQQVVMRVDMAQPQQYILQLNRQLLSPEIAQGLTLGQYYVVQGILKPAHGYAVPHVFDLEKWYLSQNWQGRLKVQHIQHYNLESDIQNLNIQQPSFLVRWQVAFEQVRLNFRLKLLATPLQHRGLILALLTGDRSLIAPNTEQLFVRFGISHLLAISGPHVLMLGLILCGCIAWAINRFKPNWYLLQPRPILLLLPFVLSVVVYSAFVGFEIPALRTLLSVIVVSLMLFLKLHLSALRLILLSASILLLIDPLSILSVAFWLSYGACFVLLRVYQTLQEQTRLQIHPQNQQPQSKQQLATRQNNAFAQIYRFLGLMWQSQWRIFVALLPIVLWSFGQVSWIAPVSNLIAIPIIGMLVVPLNILAAVVNFILPSLASIIWQLADAFLNLLMFFLQTLDRTLQPQLSNFALQPMQLLGLGLVVMLLFLPRGTLPKFWILLCLMPLISFMQPAVKAELTVIDVGQGQSVLIRDAKTNMLVDTGGYYDESIFSIGDKILLPFLRGEGIQSLQHVILSHLDQDHSGAFPALQAAMPIAAVQSNQNLDFDLMAPFSICNQGQRIMSTQFKTTILLPHNPQPEWVKNNQNEYSCVVYVQFAGLNRYQNFLIMGDAGFETELALLKAYPDLKVDVLILGHHGSKHSSSEAFLQHYRPKLAIASAGFDNRYGHPSKEVLQRLDKLSIPFLTTATSGSIRFYPQQDLDPFQFRQSKPWLQRAP